MDTKGWGRPHTCKLQNETKHHCFRLLLCLTHCEHTPGDFELSISNSLVSNHICQPAWLMKGGAHPQHPRSPPPSCFWLSLSFGMCAEMSTGKGRFAINKQMVPTGHRHSQSLYQSRCVIRASEERREPQAVVRTRNPQWTSAFCWLSPAQASGSQQRQTLVSPCHSHLPFARINTMVKAV